MSATTTNRVSSTKDILPSTMRDQLVMDYAQFVMFIAGRVAARLPDSINIDDLVSAGFMGLIDAIDKYDAQRDNKFKTYAEYRIKGAILDEIRKWDHLSRTTRDKEKNLYKTERELTSKLQRKPTTKEMASALGMSLDDFHKYRHQIDRHSRPCELSEHVIQEEGLTVKTGLPYEVYLQGQQRRLLIAAIETLGEREQKILSLHYFEDMTLKEIGLILDITESRVCQIHRKALKKITQMIREQPDLADIA